MTNLVGQSLGRYQILEQLGQGGMATVYKAYDTRLERDVAVKVLRTEHFRHEDRERSIHRFGREIEAMQRLRHPHIVPVLDYGIEDGFHYLAMEWMPGGTLRQRLGKRFDWRDAFSLVLPIIAALEHAHSNGIIHRDLKPSNILFSAENQPMLSDFGIAKVSPRLWPFSFGA